MEKIENFSKELDSYITNKNLLVFVPKLFLAPVERPATIYDVSKSKIGIEVQDFSNGKGDKNIIVRCNISIGQAEYLYERSKLGVDLEFPSDPNARLKIFGDPVPGKNGKCQCTKIFIARQKKDAKGIEKKYKWYISIENGFGIKITNANGSAYCDGKTYETDKKVQINMSDEDFFSKIDEVHNHILGFVAAYGSDKIRDEYEYVWACQEEARIRREAERKNSGSTDANSRKSQGNASTSSTNTHYTNNNDESTSNKPKEPNTTNTATENKKVENGANTNVQRPINTGGKAGHKVVTKIFTNMTAMTQMQDKGNYKISVVSKENEETELIFLKQYIQAVDDNLWNQTVSKINSGKSKFKCDCFYVASEGVGRYYFEKNLIS